ncbi:MAG: sugar nucleotide-binding protein [Candidatus Omnitrophota bacterium]
MENDILIFGNGLVAERLQEAFRCELIKEKNSLDFIAKQVKKRHPKIIINCTDYEGINADSCELNKDGTLSKNVFFPITLAEFCIRNKIKLIHVGNGCLYHFDYKKNRPLKESAKPDFFGLFYNRSMIYSDQVLSLLAEKFDILIVRIRLPIDTQPHPKNLLTKLISFKKAIRQPNSVTYIPDFISALKHLIKIKARGIYQVVNTGALYYPKLLNAYKKYNKKFIYKIIDFKDLHMVRTNLILSNAKLIQSGFKMRHIDEVLEECVKKYIKY